MHQGGRRIAACCIAHVMLLMWAGPLFAQTEPGNIPDVVIVMDGQPTASQRALIRTYARYWGERLLDGSDVKQVANARARLLDPIRRGKRMADAAPFNQPVRIKSFSDTYAAEVANAIAPGVRHEKMICRLNVIIVAAELWSMFTLDIITAALADADPAVRMWAGRAVASAMAQKVGLPPPLSEKRQQQLYDALIVAVRAETSEWAREALFQAMGSLSLPQARADMLAILEQRLDEYARTLEIDATIRSDTSGMVKAYVRLMFDSFEAGADPEALQPAVRRLVIVAAKYLQLVAMIAPQVERLPFEVRVQLDALVKGIDDVLRWGVGVLDPSAEIPPLHKPWAAGNTLDFTDHVLEIVGVLDRLGIKPADLKLPPTE